MVGGMQSLVPPERVIWEICFWASLLGVEYYMGGVDRSEDDMRRAFLLLGLAATCITCALWGISYLTNLAFDITTTVWHWGLAAYKFELLALQNIAIVFVTWMWARTPERQAIVMRLFLPAMVFRVARAIYPYVWTKSTRRVLVWAGSLMWPRRLIAWVEATCARCPLGEYTLAIPFDVVRAVGVYMPQSAFEWRLCGKTAVCVAIFLHGEFTVLGKGIACAWFVATHARALEQGRTVLRMLEE